MNYFEHACKTLGSQRAMAQQLDVAPATVNQWISGVRPLPEDRCPSIEHAVKGAVTCEELRPDVTWVRVADPEWPNPSGRPLVDHMAKTAKLFAA